MSAATRARRRRPARARTEAEVALLQQLHDWQREWTVGDECLAADGTTTTVAAMDGDRVTLTNGQQLDITKLRSVTK